MKNFYDYQLYLFKNDHFVQSIAKNECWVLTDIKPADLIVEIQHEARFIKNEWIILGNSYCQVYETPLLHKKKLIIESGEPLKYRDRVIFDMHKARWEIIIKFFEKDFTLDHLIHSSPANLATEYCAERNLTVNCILGRRNFYY